MSSTSKNILYILSIITLLLGVAAFAFAVIAAQEPGFSINNSFFRLCETNSNAACSEFSWNQLFLFVAASITISSILLGLAKKKESGGTNA